VQSSTFHKYRLLLKLLFTGPSECLDRVKTAAEKIVARPVSAGGAKGLDVSPMLDLSSKYLGLDLSRFQNDPGALAIREHIASQRALLDRPAAATIHDADGGLPDFCYIICRALRPRVVLETGVGSGVTTSFILQALAINDEGHLWSIDLPPIGAEQFAGSFVPQPLRNRWATAGLCFAAAPAIFCRHS
jgi:hypothetical protein